MEVKKETVDLVHTGILSGFRTLADGTIKIEVAINEITPVQSMKIFQLHNKFIKFMLTNKNISKDKQDVVNNLLLDAPKSTDNKTGKSPQQKLRNTMFVYYKNKYGNDEDFQKWYEDQIEATRQKYLEAIADQEI